MWFFKIEKFLTKCSLLMASYQLIKDVGLFIDVFISFSEFPVSDPKKALGKSSPFLFNFSHFHAVFGRKFCQIMGWCTRGKSWILHCFLTSPHLLFLNFTINSSYFASSPFDMIFSERSKSVTNIGLDCIVEDDNIAIRQEVSRCSTRGEFEESIAYRRRSIQKKGIHPSFETQGRHHQKSKTGVWVVTQNRLMSSKFF